MMVALQSRLRALASRRRLGALMMLVFLSVAAAPAAANAQADYFDRNNATGVLDRARPAYQATGVRLGAFTVFPALVVAPEYDDNIYASPSPTQSDLVTSISPSVQIQSNWSRHQVTAFATLASNVYADHSTENTTDFQLGASGRLDILAESNLTASFSYGHNTEPRTTEGTVQDASSPVQYDQINLGAGALQTLSRLRFSEGFNLTRISYSNATDFSGAPLLLSYLNNTTYSVNGRADYALDPQLSLFVSGQVNSRPYDGRLGNQLSRSSNGYQTTVGADFDITRLVRGQLQVGYLAQTYNSAAFHQVSGPAAHASVQYFLSGMTTVSFNLDRNVVDAVDPTVISFLQTQGSVQVDHELLRNVILSGRAGYETDDFKGVQRTDQRTSASISATYLLNRRISLTGQYSFLNEDSSGVARIGSYVVNVISLSINLHL